jgi:hypothetical protein
LIYSQQEDSRILPEPPAGGGALAVVHKNRDWLASRRRGLEGFPHFYMVRNQASPAAIHKLFTIFLALGLFLVKIICGKKVGGAANT